MQNSWTGGLGPILISDSQNRARPALAVVALAASSLEWFVKDRELAFLLQILNTVLLQSKQQQKVDDVVQNGEEASLHS